MAEIVSKFSEQSVSSVSLPIPNATLIEPSEFSVRRGYEGPQVIVEWGEAAEPAGLLSQRLVRRRSGYPVDENDGDIVYDGAPGANVVSDRDVDSCVYYYYRLFTQLDDGSYVSSLPSRGNVLAIETGYFAEKTWEILPDELITADKGLDGGEEIRRTLEEGVAVDDSPEVFNLGEDGSVLKGPYRRYLKITGPMFDEAKGLIDCLPNQQDVDEAGLAALQDMAAMLGLKLNTELSPERMRNEVRLQIPFLKQKGTIPGLIARLRSVSGLTATVVEQHNLIFFTNDPESLTPDFTAEQIAAFGGPDDTIHLSVGYPDTIPFWLWFTVFMDITDFALDAATLRKWCLVMNDSSPVCHRGFLVLTDGASDTISGGSWLEALDDELV